MTTELEQEFFKVFGIEPIEYRRNVPCLHFLTYGICNITDERCNPSKCNDYKPDKTHKNWRDFMEVYPEITDRKLLEMICILNNYGKYDCWAVTVARLEDAILENCIAVVVSKLLNDVILEQFKQQIQQLFRGKNKQYFWTV